MKASKALTLFAAAVMTASIVGESSVSSAEKNELPDWITTTLMEAMDFTNLYGKTHIEDNIICTVKKKLKGESIFYTTTDSESTCDLTAQTIYHEELVFDENDPIYIQQMKEYRESTDGLSSVYGDPLPYIYEVTAYKAPSTGKLAFDWTIGLEGTDLQSTKNFAFEVLENGKISETDLYGFLPDCVPEYEKFIANHEPISLVNGYVVICENEPENPINTNVISITGYGELKKVIRESIANENIFTGKDISGYLAVYKSVASGTAKVNYSLAGQFGFNANETVVDTKFYEIDDELNIRETDESEFIEPVPGDVNNDYQLTIADLILVQKFIFGADELSHRHNADLYNDNKIDAYDMCLMRKRLIETFAES